MVIDVRQKGATAETTVRDILRKLTGLKWERIPASGALDPKHGLKGDLYVVGQSNRYCVEVKHYADSHINHLLISGKKPQIVEWIVQAKRQAEQVDKLWLLIFKHNRSSLYCAFEDMPEGDFPYIFVSKEGHEFYLALLTDFIEHNKPKFLHLLL